MKFVRRAVLFFCLHCKTLKLCCEGKQAWAHVCGCQGFHYEDRKWVYEPWVCCEYTTCHTCFLPSPTPAWTFPLPLASHLLILIHLCHACLSLYLLVLVERNWGKKELYLFAPRQCQVNKEQPWPNFPLANSFQPSCRIIISCCLQVLFCLEGERWNADIFSLYFLPLINSYLTRGLILSHSTQLQGNFKMFGFVSFGWEMFHPHGFF